MTEREWVWNALEISCTWGWAWNEKQVSILWNLKKRSGNATQNFNLTSLSRFESGISRTQNMLNITSLLLMTGPVFHCPSVCFGRVFVNSYSGGWSPSWIHSARRPLNGLCTCPGWLWWWRIWWNEDWQGKPKYSEKTCPSATLFTTNPTWPDPGANPDRRCGKPATNRFSYGAAKFEEAIGERQVEFQSDLPVQIRIRNIWNTKYSKHYIFTFDNGASFSLSIRLFR
jgi:hypothetical protein